MSVLDTLRTVAADPVDTSKSWPAGAVAAALFAVALGIRLASGGVIPTTDEAITLRFVRQYSTIDLLWAIPLYQPHFPLYYLLLEGVGAVTGQIADAVGVSYLAGALVPVAVYRWSRTVLADWRALVAAIVVAVSPVLVVQSRWLRMYALLSLAAVCSWWAAWRWINGEGASLTYVAMAITTIGLHPFGIFITCAQLGWLAGEQYLDTWKGGFLPVASVVGGVQAVGVGILALRLVLDTGVGAVNAGSLHVSPALHPIRRLFLIPIASLTGTLQMWPLVALAGAITLWMCYQSIQSTIWQTRRGRLVIWWVGGSLILLAAAQAVFPVLMLKYLGWMAPGAALWLVSVSPNNRAFHGALGVILGLAVFDLLLAFELGSTVTKVVVWGNGVMR